MSEIKRVNLVSAGIDSYIMSEEYPGINVYVDFGQPYARQEMQALNKLGTKYEVIQVNSTFEADGIFINNRNMTMACLASLVYNPDEILMAGLADDHCVDKTEEAFEQMSILVSRFSEHQVKIWSPYWQKTKGEIIQTFRHKEKLINTFSCYTPVDDKPCGNCPACLRRVIALETNQIDTGIELSKDIITEYMRKIHTYEQDRVSRFFFYLMSKGYKIRAIDIDGVLCELDNKPFAEKIKQDDIMVSDNEFKILYTARLECDRQETETWLKNNNIQYDALIMNKLPYSTLLDDRAIQYIKEV